MNHGKKIKMANTLSSRLDIKLRGGMSNLSTKLFDIGIVEGLETLYFEVTSGDSFVDTTVDLFSNSMQLSDWSLFENVVNGTSGDDSKEQEQLSTSAI